MYELYDTFANNLILVTDSKEVIIQKLKDLELKDYYSYLDYCQRCVDNFEDPTIDERPGDYYSSYYIKNIMTGQLYDITDYRVLERREN